MKVLITGAAGQLGSSLTEAFGDQAVAFTRAEFDLINHKMIHQIISNEKPDVLINTAAYTQVDKAEEDRENCFKINATAVKVLAEECNQTNCLLIHLSTDYVFDSNQQSDTAWNEEAVVKPEAIYAQSKLQGENFALTANRSFVIRTCGLYSSCNESPVRGRNFVDTMLALAEDRNELSIVKDQTCTPTYVPHLVQAIKFLTSQEKYGLYHITNAGEVTWYEFATELFRQANIPMTLHPITSEQYGAPAKRPAFSVLDTSKYHALNGPQMPDWKDGLADYLKSLQS